MSGKSARLERPSVKAVQVRDRRAYAAVPPAYLEIARTYAQPWLMGPPLCDELMELVTHLFDPEEAEVMRHIKPYSLGKTARSIAADLKRPPEAIAAILNRLSDEKCIIMRHGANSHARYFFIPLFPGVMENILFRNSYAGVTPWHTRFADLFDKLYDTGYITDYGKHPAEMVRVLPVNQGITADARAWPSDRLEEILAPFRSFAVTYCQCRLTMDLKGESCGKPLETCVMMGALAEQMIRNGRMRRIDRHEVLDIKRNAEAHGLVTWVGNVDAIAGSNISCSCCGCCCYMLRLTTQFHVPTMIAPPHFRPHHHPARCTACGACARLCQTGAITVDTIRTFHPERCLGCGLCVGACVHAALELQEAPAGRKPPRNALQYLTRVLPNIIRNTLYAVRTHAVK